jgi:hypothetical protein
VIRIRIIYLFKSNESGGLQLFAARKISRAVDVADVVNVVSVVQSNIGVVGVGGQLNAAVFAARRWRAGRRIVCRTKLAVVDIAPDRNVYRFVFYTQMYI